MTYSRFEDHVESDREREEGHVDTRQANHECPNPDKNLGCDLGIDVAGQPDHSKRQSFETKGN